MEGAVFDSPETLKRVLKSTLVVEGVAEGLGAFPTHAITQEGRVWAKITGNTGTVYNCTPVERVNGAWVNRPEWGTVTAKEAQGSSTSLTSKVVELIPVANEDNYVFELPSTPPTDDGSGHATNDNCCSIYASPKGAASETDCTTTNLQPQYQFSFPNLEHLWLDGTDQLVPLPTGYVVEYDSSCTFETDTIDYAPKNAPSADQYHWELAIGADRNPGSSTLTLVHDSGSNNPEIVDLVYENWQPWDSLTGCKFWLTGDRFSMPTDVSKWAPCELCITGVNDFVSAPCLVSAATYFDRDTDAMPWPSTLYFDTVGYTGTWASQTNVSGRLDWLVGDPNNSGNPDYIAWGKAPIDPNNTGSLPNLPNKFSVGSVTFGGITGSVNIYPCVWCAHEYNIFYFQFHDGLPIGYGQPWSNNGFNTGYYTLYFTDCTGGTSGDNYSGANSMPSLVDQTTKKFDFLVTYQLWINSDPGSPDINGCTPRTISGTPPSWEFTIHVYEQ